MKQLIKLKWPKQLYEQLWNQMAIKFSVAHSQDIKVGFKLPSGENVYYTFEASTAVKVCNVV